MTTAEVRAGDVLPPLAIEPISRTTLALFAGASGDHNPIHIDLDVAREAGRDDVFAHGMLSMAFLARYLVGWRPQAQLRRFHVRFTAITPVHARPVCTGRVVSVEDGIAKLELAVTPEGGPTTIVGEALVAIGAE